MSVPTAIWPIAGLLLVCASLPGCSETQPRSVILVTIDTLRGDRISTHGRRVTKPPVMAALAARGRTYTHAYSASSSTAPSHASILTGLFPSWHTIGSINGIRALHSSTDTLAEIFSDAGFRTGAIVSNPVLKASLGLDQGFETYDDQFEGSEIGRKIPERYADRAVDLSLAWLDSIGDEAFFLWLHLQDPHGPYAPPERHACSEVSTDLTDLQLPAGTDHSGYEAIPRYQLYRAERHVLEYQQRYDCEISYTDQELGRLLDWVNEHSANREILVAVSSDHGEAMGEEGFFFAHGHSLGLDQVHVPLILAGPGIAAGETVEMPVTNVALFATILDFAGLPLPVEGAPPSLLRPKKATEISTFYMECLNQVAIVHGNALLRTDLRPATDLAFWQGGNPNSGGFWKPLGEQVVAPLSPSLKVEDRAVDDARVLIARYINLAAEARLVNADLIRGVDLPAEQRKALESLGYIE